MPFLPHDSRINKGGRPMGALNKTTRITVKIKEDISDILNNTTAQIKEDLSNLPPELRIKYFIELAKFVLPHQKAVNYQSDPDYLEENTKDIRVTIVQ